VTIGQKHVLKTDTSEFKSKLKLRNEVGKPKIETVQPYFLEAVVNIAMQGSAAQEKRRNEICRCILTLDDLTAQLNRDSFDVTRSSVYLRLKLKTKK
jgi:hypothetical protein